MIHKLADVQSKKMGKNTNIWQFCVIMKNAIIGADSVVTNDISKNQLWYGNSATHKWYVCKCGKKSDSNFICLNCKKI